MASTVFYGGFLVVAGLYGVREIFLPLLRGEPQQQLVVNLMSLAQVHADPCRNIRPGKGNGIYVPICRI